MDCSKAIGPNCGSALRPYDCTEYCIPGLIETRIVNMPQRCIKPPCYYTIPAVPCKDEIDVKCPGPNPLCFDWTVDEPGPNDSYGLKGLNWHDFAMDYYNQSREEPGIADDEYVPEHPGFNKRRPYEDTPIFQCNRPIECYSRFPHPCIKSPFAIDVNYFRDWRCCKGRAFTRQWYHALKSVPPEVKPNITYAN